MRKQGKYFEDMGIEFLPDEWRHFCTTHSIKHDLNLDADEIFDEFVDHWISASGQNARKRDWFATWRNWIRRQRPKPKQQSNWQVWAAQHGIDARPGETEWQWKQRVEIARSGH